MENEFEHSLLCYCTAVLLYYCTAILLYYCTTVFDCCSCDGKNLVVPEQTMPILVSAIADPEISISGVKAKRRTAEEFSAVSPLPRRLFYSVPTDMQFFASMLRSLFLSGLLPKL